MSEAKKLSMFRIYQIFLKYSDIDHPLTQNDIKYRLQKDYDIVLERKAISRNISYLREGGIDISSSRKGYYIVDRLFTDVELRLLIDMILANKYISHSHSKELIDKLVSLSNIYFKSHIRYAAVLDEQERGFSKELFYTIEVIDEAIAKHKNVSFTYNLVDRNLSLHPMKDYVVKPMHMLVHEQAYYLSCKIQDSEEIHFFRIDKLTNIRLSE